MYLLEQYVFYKVTTAYEVFTQLAEKELADFVYDMYEIYHAKTLENAFADIDSLIGTEKTAW